MIAYDQAIKVNPRSPLVWEVKSAAPDGYYNKPEEAIKTYEKGIEINKKY
jgi:tetratricopeptide (TPR) repeat protein